MTPINYRIRIEPDKFYHIWNRGNNRENLFYTSANYEYFLRLYAEFLDPVAETYAFCLLPNHFHLLIRTKAFAQSLEVSPTGETSRKANPVSLAFQRLFTAYSQAINIQQHRTGSLFQKPFKRLEVKSAKQLANLVHYIHTNPQRHGITDDFRQYPWSSYERIIIARPSKLKKEEVLAWFKNKENYLDYHTRTINPDELKETIIE
ncbi:MAG: transposase [Prolixibacteraceae bacterium]|nr:transposase [Prolixibacteraceae bacterium]